ncbi:MAG: PfkB family carbohydrate kinase [Chloroherpetonaceae bacterium]|nr:PfkB family carbohydrate kinase [Chloroherpetonaceae bacterium]
MSILVVGSLVFDTLHTPHGTADNILGGSATYITLAASHFEKPVRLVGIVGSDFNQHLPVFTSRKIDTEGLQIVEGGKTFRWGGKYHDDMNTRDSLYTELNVFAEFNPVIPSSYQETEFICLGNIDPILQRRVLEQVKKPKLIVCDTMDFWISGMLSELKDTLKLVDVLIINDSEARALSGERNLISAAKKIRAMGPKILVIKKGEHGALLFTDSSFFSAAAFPLESIFDPTGAGDTFAGGFVGYLSQCNDLSEMNLRKAVIYGSTLASFTVEKFGIERLAELTKKDVEARYNDFLRISHIAP